MPAKMHEVCFTSRVWRHQKSINRYKILKLEQNHGGGLWMNAMLQAANFLSFFFKTRKLGRSWPPMQLNISPSCSTMLLRKLYFTDFVVVGVCCNKILTFVNFSAGTLNTVVRWHHRLNGLHMTWVNGGLSPRWFLPPPHSQQCQFPCMAFSELVLLTQLLFGPPLEDFVLGCCYPAQQKFKINIIKNSIINIILYNWDHSD